MKTSSSARRLVKTKIVLSALLLGVLIGSELWLGGAFAAQVGQTTSSQSENYPVPNVGIVDLMAGAR